MADTWAYCDVCDRWVCTTTGRNGEASCPVCLTTGVQILRAVAHA